MTGQIGLFTNASGAQIAAGETRVATSGWSVVGKGAAAYVEDAAVTQGDGRTTFVNSGRGFRLAPDTTVTPYMLGARGDDVTDDSDALQAFFDHAFPDPNGRRFIYDWQGKWRITKTIYACYPAGLTEKIVRRFVCGTLRVQPVADQQGGVAMREALVIGGPGQNWSGFLYVNGRSSIEDFEHYSSRRYGDAVRLINCNSSQFGAIRGEGAYRDVVNFDDSGSITLREGTPFAVTYLDSNNISVHIEWVLGYSVGSTTQGVNNGLKLPFAAVDQGGTTNGDDFDTDHLKYFGSHNQRTQIGVATTAHLRRYDWGKVRYEMGPLRYGTIAADKAQKTLTWSDNDPTAANGFAGWGLDVGETIIPQSGVNAGRKFEIVGFSGSSNRVITVHPAPEDEAATAITGLFTAYTYHQIMNIPPSGTLIEVFPWLPHRHASGGTWVSMHGHVADVKGGNTANVTIGFAGGTIAGGVLGARGLYGPEVGSVLAEICEVGINQGLYIGAAALGTAIGHIHAEESEVNLLQTTASSTSRLKIGGGSNFYLDRVYCSDVRLRPEDGLTVSRPLVNTTIDIGGELVLTGYRFGSYSGRELQAGVSLQTGDYNVTNHPSKRVRTVVADSGTIELDFDDDVAKLFGEHHRAEVMWTGPLGAAPAGTLAFQRSANLTSRGWSFAAPSSFGPVTKSCLVKVIFHKETKTILLHRFDSAAP